MRPATIGPVRVRPVTLDDAAAISNLSMQLGYAANAAVIRRRLRALAARPECVVVLAEAEAPMGWATAECRQALIFERRVELTGLVVDLAYRRMGVARALLAAVETWAVGQGADAVFLRSNVVRPEAHGFYPAVGYTQTKTQHAYMKVLAPHR